MYGNKEPTEEKKSGKLFSDTKITDNKIDLSETKKKHSTQQEHKFISNSELSNCRVQPYPFTFISAVRQKLALAVQHDNDDIKKKLPQDLVGNKIEKMDFIKPLKVPKINPKISDYFSSSRENTTLRKNLSPIQSVIQQSEEIILHKESDRISRSSDRVSRKLDFLSSQELLNDDMNVKTPDVSSQSFSRKKFDHSRDNSREKENRSKRIKKDDLNLSREGDSSIESIKRIRNSKHVSRRDIKDLLSNSSIKSDRHTTHLIKDNDPVKKTKTKNFGLSNKKDDEKKIRSASLHSGKLSRDKSLEARGKTTSSESISDRNYKLHDYITVREGSRSSIIDTNHKYNSNDCQSQSSNGLSQISDQQKYHIALDSKQLKHQFNPKESYKKNLEKTKLSTNKIHHRSSGMSVHDSRSDDNELITKSDSIYTELSSQQLKNKDDKIIAINNPNPSQNLTSFGELNSIGVNKKIDASQSSDDLFLDSRKISFRDHNYSPQEEFCNLVTPNLNLVSRPKRKKDLRCKSLLKDDLIQGSMKQKSHPSNDKQEDMPLLHPTALHMQFQAELHLFDSYNESIRQVIDVENSLYNVKQDQAREKLQMQQLMADTNKHNSIPSKVHQVNSNDLIAKENIDIEDDKVSVKVAEVQTQTANDIATQTDTLFTRDNNESRLLYPEITYTTESSINTPKMSLKTIEFEDFNQLDDISLPNKMRTMSEISLHETTSSIKTETGTEINISTRDVTCSFNKDIDLEMAQLIKDEKQMYDKIEMLFKSREKTLHDRTRKLVKLEEQKRALRDTGQDSRISSVKKKQRALLLKLQQEKDEMNRLKELHKLASQERKVMLQKQRNMFNPQMSTKNFLTKLKRSADSQSPRRLSGPMKGYDIRSNSSISSLIDSDKSQIDRSQLDEKMITSDVSINDKTNEKSLQGLETLMSQKIIDLKNDKYKKFFEESSNSSHLEISSPQKCHQMRARKFEEKMPKSDLLCLKGYHLELGSKLQRAHQNSNNNNNNNISVNKTLDNSSDIKTESDTLVEELSKKSKLKDRNDIIGDNDHEITKNLKKSDKPMIIERDSLKKFQYNQESKVNSKRKNTKNLKSKSPANVLTENLLKSKLNLHTTDDIVKYKRSKVEKELLQPDDEYRQPILDGTNLNDSQNSFQALVKHSQAVKEKNNKLLRDIANERGTAENISTQHMIENGLIDYNTTNINMKDGDIQNLGNISTRSQVSTFTISRHSSGDSEKSYSRSVVIRSQQDHQFKTSKKLEQVLHAREAALNTRRNCVEDWIAWHAKLKAEENRVARMEEAALKLVTATTNAFSCNDTTISSDTSEVEGRVELLAEQLAERHAEMAKLKKEARRQAKQRLKTLEANLLNQITKYDMTINEMRNKLEHKRNSMKESGKLAIEAKSIADLKVPEIPIKRIQEIYKKNESLRSHLESDKNHNNAVYQSTSSFVNKNNDQHHISHSIQSVLEKAITPSASKKISEPLNSKKVDKSEVSSKQSSNILISSNGTGQKSNISTSINSKISTNASSNKISSNQSSDKEINENSPSIFSNKINSLHLNNDNLTEDISTLENDLKTLSELVSRFSKKSDKKLRSGYNQPESELSTLKDITEDLSKSEVVEATIHSKSKSSENIIDVSKVQDQSSSMKTQVETIPDDASTVLPTKSLESKSSDEIDFEAKSKEILNVIEKSIISEHCKLSASNFEITGAALEQSMLNLHKNNEALSSDFNSLEGDIKSISEIISKMNCSQNLSTVADNLTSSHTSDDSFSPQPVNVPSLDLNKLEQDSQITIEEIDSNISNSMINHDKFSHQEIDYSTETVEQSSDKITENNESIDEEQKKLSNNDSKIIEKINSNENILETINDRNKNTEDTTCTSGLESKDSGQSPLNTSRKEKSDKDDVPSEERNHDWESYNSLEAVSRDIEDHELSQLDENSEEHNDLNEHTMNSYKKDSTNDTEIEESLFIPTGESTNIHELHAQLKEMTIDMLQGENKSHTDELSDILDIIARDQAPELSKPLDIPNELNDEPQDVPSNNNELNMTTDYEPVLQKITESLQSLERNIEKHARNKELGNVYRTGDKVENVEEVEKIDSKIKLNEYLDEALDLLHEEHNDKNKLNEGTEKLTTELQNSNKLKIDKFKKFISHTTQVKDPDYEDISEESLEVSEILDKSENLKSQSQKSNKMLEKYEAVQQPDNVLRILDEISQKSLLKITTESFNQKPLNFIIQSEDYLDINPIENLKSTDNTGVVIEEIYDVENNEEINSEKYSEHDKDLSKKDDTSAEISEDADVAETPRGISEIDMDSTKDQNESRLDMEILNDSLLADNESNSKCSKDSKVEFKSDGVHTTSEKDIEVMIDKLRASLNQPGLEVVDLNARLLRIEQLQIELQIKQLEAEEVSYYIREIPNKPPPPYTPPSIGSLSSPESSPTLSHAIVPTNIDELTAFTEKATVIIFDAKQSGKDIMALEAPPEINELHNDNNKVVKKDRKIYNTFLFDLCKETIAEVYQLDYEKPGPSWIKPNVKTKPVIKIPKTIEELNDYVNKEVATLFGFKTKLQRENMVMRWSRKRRDRVDELLAREAQAEEDEWTKFHHDELAVKNELTVAILGTLILETTNVVKTVYAKKRRIMF
ncbi:centrosome-associated protein 350-like [Microplitis mediator]|uniref:centrosome-associated protein 350-like n=1 Tax=Microplitis mediator TaxID=375433 RepID=UPI002556EFE7|nr:centrosome-associated protein 350-like [Microplitis mediator]